MDLDRPAVGPEQRASPGHLIEQTSHGQSNRFGHPSANTIAELAPAAIYRTDLQGSSAVTIANQGYTVQSSR